MSNPIINPGVTATANAGRIVWSGNKKYICAYYDGSSPSTLAVGQPVQIIGDVTDGTLTPKVRTVATLAVYCYIGVAIAAIGTTAGWYWFQIGGPTSLLVNGNSAIGAGDYLKVVNAADNAIVDSASARSVNSMAISLEIYAVNADVVKNAFLLGDRVVI